MQAPISVGNSGQQRIAIASSSSSSRHLSSATSTPYTFLASETFTVASEGCAATAFAYARSRASSLTSEIFPNASSMDIWRISNPKRERICCAS
jgi:hypothetical protein